MILAYKGFDLDLSCTSRGNRFQYAPDRWNEEPRAKCGENGFHCAENPLDCVAMGAGRILEVNYEHNEAVSDPA